VKVNAQNPAQQQRQVVTTPTSLPTSQHENAQSNALILGGSSLNNNVELTEAENYALYVDDDCSRATTSEFDELSVFYCPVNNENMTNK
jgi:hypothetical protein